MDATGSTAIRKLSITVAVAVALLLIYRLWPQGPLSGLAIGGFALVAGPVFILVLIDTGRALRRRHLSRVGTVATWLPQLFLGSAACIAGMGGLGLIAFSQFASYAWHLWTGIVSLGVLMYGLYLLREVKAGDN
jgi:hypothetical protein